MDGHYEYSPAVVEGPDRYQMMLYNLARGHAIAEGRHRLTEEDITLVARVTLSSGPEERRRLFRAVISDPEALGSDDAAVAIRCSVPTARAVARDMASVGLLHVEGDSAMRIGLLREHEWLRKFSDGV